MIAIVLVGTLAVMSSPPATVQAAHTPAEPACLRACEEEISNSGQRDCLLRDEERAQRLLDAEVAAVTKEHSNEPDVLAAFNDTQTAWIAYYSADCHAVNVNWTGGSGRRTATAFCRADHIRRRAFDIWLNYHLESLPEPGRLCTFLRPDA